ncbi:hypothetical protein ACFLU8_05190 [Chloroflexota bacterium]
MDAKTILIIALIFALLLLAMIIVPQWRLRRSIRQVIRIFRDQNAIGIKNARTVDELGLRPRRMLEGMFKGRDYKQYALNALMKSEIIQMTEERKLYLSEDKLLSSGLEKGSLYSR